MEEPSKEPDFASRAQARRQGLLSDFWAFLRDNKKWWLLPLLGVILILGLLVLVGGSAVAPFIYTLF